MIMQMILLKFNVVEIPAVMHARESGESSAFRIEASLVYVPCVFQCTCCGVPLQKIENR